MKNLFSYFIITGLFFFSASSLNFAQDEADLMKIVEEMGNQYEKMMLAGDYESMYAFYSDDVISMPSYQPMIIGLDNIKKMNEEQSMVEFTAFEITPVKVFADGKFMFEIGTYSLTMNIPGMDQPYSDNGKYLNVYENQNEEWKIKAETWNSDVNPWMMMGNPEDDSPEIESPEEN